MSAKSIPEADGKAILNYHLILAPVIKASPLPAYTAHDPLNQLVGAQESQKDVWQYSPIYYVEVPRHQGFSKVGRWKHEGRNWRVSLCYLDQTF
ncbi:unnamed protein product [Fusarium langsethiae]|nr:unnamed protein product [Fusarium langsethiae]GKU19679.1 unnamed protein product [Fusarium langsethiae]